MSKRDVKNISILLVLFVYVILYRLFIFPNHMGISEIVTASFLLILTGVAVGFLGYRKDKRTILRDNIFRIVIFYLILTFVIMFGLGFFSGFLKNAYSRSAFTLFDNVFAPMLIIIFMELLRYVFVGANKDKKGYIYIMVIIFIMFESIISIGMMKSYDIESLFHTFASILLPITVKNIVLTYLTYHVGYKVPMLYRLVVDTYIFFVPVVPNIGEYVNSMIFISLPILIYMSSFGLVDDRTKKLEPVFNNDNFTVFDIPVAIVLITMICLISGYFTYTMMGVGSDSMSPKINRGDAVIIKKLDKKTKIEKGTVVAYNKDKKVIVHRIKSINKDGTFTTKGDANNASDKDAVKRKQIKGIVKFKIPFIAYPTLWFNDLINGNS